MERRCQSLYMFLLRACDSLQCINIVCRIVTCMIFSETSCAESHH